MQAVTITQITPAELETLIENSVRKVLKELRQKPTADIQEIKITPNEWSYDNLISARLENALLVLMHDKGIKYISEISVYDLSRQRNVGKQTINEWKAFSQTLQ